MNKLINGKNKFLNYFLDLMNNLRESNIRKFIRKRLKLIIVILIGIFLFLGYFIGRVNSSRDRIIGKLEVALKDGDVSKLSKIVKLDGKKVDKEKLKPLINYYNVDSSRSDSAIRILKVGGETEAFKLESRNSLFGTDYYIDLNTYKLKVKSNFEEGIFTINNKDYVNGDEEQKGLIPGIYSVDGKLKSDYGDVESSKELVLMKDEEIDVDFPAIKVKVESKYEDSEIFVNEEDTNIKVKDGEEIGPFATDGSVLLHIENDFPWGRIKSEDVAVRNTPNMKLDINMENDEMKSELEEASNDFYNSVFKSLNYEDKNSIKAATETTRDKIYDILEKKYIFLKNEYTIKNVNIDNEKSQYDYNDGIYRAILVVKVDYEIKKSFLGLNKSNNSKLFFTKLIYDENGWKIDDVENFSL
ncbi:TcaA 3rd/4th domain-containing protein [Clostridium cibarium]|uniref:TcaA 4th domain-containing protein n=1 Tax=Clostridium cibarium TaxID=2762247 RepID=A0ABR8PXW7_9CLOT|nr:hypothetical protein [Clostridium cibarium]MBD7913009.1 hypothetical protein [Clostridium cibarium]